MQSEEFRVQGQGLNAPGVALRFKFGNSDLGFRISDLGFRISGSECRILLRVWG